MLVPIKSREKERPSMQNHDNSISTCSFLSAFELRIFLKYEFLDFFKKYVKKTPYEIILFKDIIDSIKLWYTWHGTRYNY